MRPIEPGLTSVIIPVGGRRADLPALYRDYKAGMSACGGRFEFLFVLDGPHPVESRALQALVAAREPVVVVQLLRPFGEATALLAGMAEASGERLLSLPAYHQIDHEGIGRLLTGLYAADLVVANRSPRAGNWFERLRRRLFHAALSLVTRQRFHDLGCGARAMTRQVLEEIRPYGEQARYLPVLAQRVGFRVQELDVRQSPQDQFRGVYGPRAYAQGLLDILTMLFVTRFTKKPLRFFGMIGLVFCLLGGAVLLWLVGVRLLLNEPLADRPALLLSSLLLVLGLQLFALGLLGELLIFTHGRGLQDFQIAEIRRGAAPATTTPPPPTG